jgi:hypothetical protein
MFSRNSMLISLAIVVGCLLIAIVPQLFGQGDEPRSFAGRYRATAVGNSGSVFVCDTMTGECWYGSIAVKWRSLGKPVDESAANAANPRQ